MVGTIYREISTEIGTGSSQPNLSLIQPPRHLTWHAHWRRVMELPGALDTYTCANPPPVHVPGCSTRFPRLCELPLCRSIPGVEGEARFAGKNAPVCCRAYIGVPCHPPTHYTEYNFGHKCLKGLITGARSPRAINPGCRARFYFSTIFHRLGCARAPLLFPAERSSSNRRAADRARFRLMHCGS